MYVDLQKQAEAPRFSYAVNTLSWAKSAEY